MAFYLEPPRGNISLQKLEKFAVRRLNFLIQIHKLENDHSSMRTLLTDSANVTESECLIEGTIKDSISHFILRLACSGDRTTETFFVRAESTLFRFRFASMSRTELVQFFTSLDSSLKKIGNFSVSIGQQILMKSLKALVAIKKAAGSWDCAVQWYMEHRESVIVRIPFEIVFHMVARRAVALHKGLAEVPYCKLDQLLDSIFSQNLIGGLKRAAVERIRAAEDERINTLFQKLVGIIRQKLKYPSRHGCMVTLSHNQLDEESSRFPPCMLHLHNVLRDKHRLNHHARIQYTLFLKAAGLPVHEALLFWRKEYSKEAKSKDGCTHHWQDHERRYTYNIRHLYGLEGSCINYRSHCCSSLQNASSCSSGSDGCFFKSCDSDNLLDLLKNSSVEESFEKIHQLCEEARYSAACRVYYRRLLASHKTKKVNRHLNDEHAIIDHKPLTDSRHEDKHCRKRKREAEGPSLINQSGRSESIPNICYDVFTDRTNLAVLEKRDTFRGNQPYSTLNRDECSTRNSTIKTVCEESVSDCDFSNSSDIFEDSDSDITDLTNSENTTDEKCQDISQEVKMINSESTSPEIIGSYFRAQNHRDTSLPLMEIDQPNCSVDKSFPVSNSSHRSTGNTRFEDGNQCDPEVCPSQCKHRQKAGSTNEENGAMFLSPVDFYISLRKLVLGLKTSVDL